MVISLVKNSNTITNESVARFIDSIWTFCKYKRANCLTKKTTKKPMHFFLHINSHFKETLAQISTF